MDKKNGLSKLCIVFLIFVIGGLLGYIACDKMSNDKSESKETSNKTESNSNVTTSNTQEQTNNSYEIFANNFKKQFSKFNSNNMSAVTVTSDVIEDGYTVSLNEKQELFIEYANKALASKYGKAKLADKVLSFYVIEAGQGGGHDVYFIYEDGTVGCADVEYSILDNVSTIPVKKVEEYKNIVSVVNGYFSAEHSSAMGPIFIDINGNMYSQNLK